MIQKGVLLELFRATVRSPATFKEELPAPEETLKKSLFQETLFQHPAVLGQ